MSVLLYHNPKCSKSRATLDLLRSHGVEPKIIDYLNDPPSEADLEMLRSTLGCTLVEMMRTQEAPYKDLGLDGADDEALIGAIRAYPILLQRPIVVNGQRAAIGRPPENVLSVI